LQHRQLVGFTLRERRGMCRHSKISSRRFSIGTPLRSCKLNLELRSHVIDYRAPAATCAFLHAPTLSMLSSVSPRNIESMQEGERD